MAGSPHHPTPSYTEPGEVAQRRLAKKCIQGATVRSKETRGRSRRLEDEVRGLLHSMTRLEDEVRDLSHGGTRLRMR